MRKPSVRFLPETWQRVARQIAQRLAEVDQRGWIVGGAVRDLALGIEAVDVDMASAASPEQIEQLFPRTFAVGKAFGTMVVHLEDLDVQLTTFRSEQGFSDGRRPDQVQWGHTVEEDALRRDFTCNALYLDPLTDELLDPTGGLEDLRAGRLACVGEARERFREDGLRLVRMARLAGFLGLEVADDVLAAAREEVGALRGVSSERVLGELQRMFAKPGSATAIGLLAEVGLLAPLLPDLEQMHPATLSPEQALELRLAVLRDLDPPGVELGLAILFEPDPRDPAGPERDLEKARDALDRLGGSRELRRAVMGLWRVTGLAGTLCREALATRSSRMRVVRDGHWAAGSRLLAAWLRANDDDQETLQDLVSWGTALREEELWPTPLIESSDLADAGLERGPLWGRLLEEAETCQLDRRFADRDQALAWLKARVAVLQEGGKTRRSAKDSG